MKKILITVGCLLSSNAFSSGKTLWRSAKDLYYDAMNSEVPDIIKFNAAMTMAVSAAKEGNAKALNLLGENFWWVQHSDLQTSQLSLFKLSADKGDERGLFNYGKLLIETSKTPSDFDCGMEYIRLSVGKRTPGGKRICVEALVAFSFHLLDNGHSERAIFYLELAANVKPSQFRIPIHAVAADRKAGKCSGELGCLASSQITLGMCYRDGVGAPVDLQKAMHYFLQAAELGHMPYYYNTCAAIVELKAQEGKEEEAEHSLALFRQNARYQSSQFARFVSKKNTSFLEHAQ